MAKKKNNSKKSNKNKYVKERNKNNINIHYLSQIQNLKINNKINNSKINQKRNIINNYFLKENDSKKHIKSNSSINDKENDAIKKQNYVTFYGDRLINSKKNELKKLLYENSNKKYKNFFINNKNIQKQYLKSTLLFQHIIPIIFSTKKFRKRKLLQIEICCQYLHLLSPSKRILSKKTKNMI